MKHVYLDQRDWISLAKAAKGRPDGARFTQALDAARDAVGNRRAVFPLSFAHLTETMRAPKLEQRRTLAKLMSELSTGVVLRKSRALVEFQLRNAARRMFGEPLLRPEPSPFGRNPGDAFGVDLEKRRNIPPARAAEYRAIFETPEAWFSLLSHEDEPARRKTIHSMDRIANQAVSDYETRRSTWDDLDLDGARRAYAAITTMTFQVELERALHEIGRTIVDWGNAGVERIMAFWESAPMLHVELELHTQMHLQRTKPWSTHDDRDIISLALAIPNCDAVVTEQFWVDLSRRRHLGERYGTILTSDLTSLPEMLTV